MKILFSIHLFPPKHLCGAEIYALNIIKHLQSKGHECRVLLHQAATFNIKVPYEYDGIWVDGNKGTMDQYTWADVLVTHLDYTHKTIMIGKIINKPVICIVHNTHPYQSIQNTPDLFIVYNSAEAKRIL